MSDIIFQKILNNLNETTSNINNYFNNADYYNTNIYDIVALMFRNDLDHYW